MWLFCKYRHGFYLSSGIWSCGLWLVWQQDENRLHSIRLLLYHRGPFSIVEYCISWSISFPWESMIFTQNIDLVTLGLNSVFVCPHHRSTKDVYVKWTSHIQYSLPKWWDYYGTFDSYSDSSACSSIPITASRPPFKAMSIQLQFQNRNHR